MAKRRQFVVDRTFQLKYTMLITVIGGVISLIFAGWMWNATVTSTEMLDLGEIAQGELLRGEIQSHMAYLPWLYVGITLMMMAALGLLGVLITHRVAGPAFVMGRYLGIVGDGFYPSLRPLRKRDELHSFFDAFERAIVTLRDRDKTEAEAISAVISKLEEAGVSHEDLEVLRKIRDRKNDSIAGSIMLEGQTKNESSQPRDSGT